MSDATRCEFTYHGRGYYSESSLGTSLVSLSMNHIVVACKGRVSPVFVFPALAWISVSKLFRLPSTLHKMSASTQLFLSATASQLDVSQALPSYTPTASTEWDVPAAKQQHAFSLVNKKSGTQWLSLTVTSRAASNTDPPTFFQGGDVSGTCRLNLDTEEVVDDITITVSGM